MADKGIPYIDDLKSFLAKGAGHSVLDFRTGPEVTRFAVSQDVLNLLIGKLKDLNFAWEKRHHEVDPGASKPGDVRPMTAIKPSSVNVGKIPGTSVGGIVFATNSGPQVFALSEGDMVDLAHRLLQEAGRTVPPIRNH